MLTPSLTSISKENKGKHFKASVFPVIFEGYSFLLFSTIDIVNLILALEIKLVRDDARNGGSLMALII